MTLWYWHGVAPLSESSFEGSHSTSELHAHLPEQSGHLTLSQLKETKNLPFFKKLGWKAIPKRPSSASKWTSSVRSRNRLVLSIVKTSLDPWDGIVAKYIIPAWSDRKTRLEPSGWGSMLRKDPFASFSRHIPEGDGPVAFEMLNDTAWPLKHTEDSSEDPPKVLQKSFLDFHISDIVELPLSPDWDAKGVLVKERFWHSLQNLAQKSMSARDCVDFWEDSVELQSTGTCLDSDSARKSSAAKGSHFCNQKKSNHYYPSKAKADEHLCRVLPSKVMTWEAKNSYQLHWLL